MNDADARDRVARIDALLGEVETLPDPVAREAATELVGALVDLYGEGLARLLEYVADPQPLVSDEVVSHLLLLHGLHPQPLEARVRAALDGVRPYLDAHGGDVELLGIEAGVARLRLQGSCNGCPSSAVTLKTAIEKALHEAAPDLEGIEADGAVEPPSGLVELPIVCEIPR